MPSKGQAIFSYVRSADKKPKKKKPENMNQWHHHFTMKKLDAELEKKFKATK